jgi:hypothetical protein
VPAVPEPLPPAARKKLIGLMRRGGISPYLALDAGTVAGQFIRKPAGWKAGRPPELALPDESGWVWGYLESRLGPSHEKEYLPDAE